MMSTTPEKYQKTTRRAASAAEFGDVLLDVLRLEKDGDTSSASPAKLAGQPQAGACYRALMREMREDQIV
jgi:hypothetical protein